MARAQRVMQALQAVLRNPQGVRLAAEAAAGQPVVTSQLPSLAARTWQSAAPTVRGWSQLHTGFGAMGVPAMVGSAGRAVVAPATPHTGQISFAAVRRMCSTVAAGGAAAAPAVHRGIAAGLSDSTAKQLSAWLGITSGWVASMVVLGGVTRLTRSGLSMTDWKFTGEKPPRSQADWEAEFAKYQRSPEYQRVNRGMGLDEFKFIYWMEYSHRMWGRLLGVVFAGPALWFAARGAVARTLAGRLGLLFLMGGTQGAVGWWMVESGLHEPEKHYDTPRVSPYRLAAHLASAFSIYAVLFWTTLSLAAPVPALAAAAPAVQRAAARLRGAAVPLAALIAVTAASGAFVAGLDAGHAYNTFPLMGGRVVPKEYAALPGWRNAFENTAAVQFHHRVLAVSTLTAVGATWLTHRRMPLPAASRRWLNGLMAVTAAQVTLGVFTLLMYVPVSLGAAHQAGALTLFTVVLGLLHSLRRPHAQAPALARAFTPLAAAATIGVWAVVLQAPKEVPSVANAMQTH